MLLLLIRYNSRMRIFVFLLSFIAFANIAFAQTEEQGIFNLNQNPLEPGQAPVNDSRLAPGKDGGGIILPQENNDLPSEAAILFAGKKKKSVIGKDFIFGFITGGAFIAFVSFFMLKFSRKERDNQ